MHACTYIRNELLKFYKYTAHTIKLNWELRLPEGDMYSALFLGTTSKSRSHIFRNACTARQFALSGNNICSTSYGWYNFTSCGQGSWAEKRYSSLYFQDYMNSGPTYYVWDFASNFNLTYLQVLKTMIPSIIPTAFQFCAITTYNTTIGTPDTSTLLSPVIHSCQKLSNVKCVRKLVEARAVQECRKIIKLEMVCVRYQSLNIGSNEDQGMACFLIRNPVLFKASNSKVWTSRSVTQ